MRSIDAIGRNPILEALESSRHEALLSVAASHPDRSLRDRDLLRAVLQEALTTGDMDLVKRGAKLCFLAGLCAGDLMLSLEGICLLRNIGSEVEEETTALLDALDARGFADHTTPDPGTRLRGDASGNAPELSEVLASLEAELNKHSSDDGPFYDVALWPHLERSTRKELIGMLHLETRRQSEMVFEAPRLVMGWIASGALMRGEQVRWVAPGTLVHTAPGSGTLRASSHLRILGMSEERWQSFTASVEGAAAWQRALIREHIFGALATLDGALVADTERCTALLKSAVLTYPGASAGPAGHARIVLVIEGRQQIRVAQGDRVTPMVVGPGSLLRIPSEVAFEGLSSSALRWNESTFEEHVGKLRFHKMSTLEVAPAQRNGALTGNVSAITQKTPIAPPSPPAASSPDRNGTP